MTQSPPLRARRDRARALMADDRLDLLLLGPGAGFRYLTGRNAILTERFVALAINARGNDVIFAPRLQAPLYQGLDGIDVEIWEESADPLLGVAKHAQAGGSRRIAVNTEFWSGFLLGLQSHLPSASFLRGAGIVDRLRIVKEDSEIAALETAAQRIDAVWAAFCAGAGRLAGRTELELRTRIDGLMREHGFDEVSWVDVGAGANGASPLHHGSNHVIAPGEPVVFDFAGCFGGYYGDICRVAISGAPHPDFLAVYQIVRDAQEAAFQAVQPGVAAQAIDAVARDHIAAHGFGAAFTHRLGHGIGLAAHEEPYIVAGNANPLKPGMTFSNEPGIYIPGRFGVRIEDIVVVTQDGARRLTQSPRDLVLLD